MKPRVRTINKDRNNFFGTYKGHEIYLSRESYRSPWWIEVRHPDGGYLYQGEWTISHVAKMREAIIQALKGSCLYEETK